MHERLYLAGLIVLCCTLFVQTAPSAIAQQVNASDTTDSNSSSWFILPSVFYTPETRIAGGIVPGYFFQLDPESYPSSVVVPAIYTANNQFILNIQSELYRSQNRERYAAEFQFQRYPDVFFGFGPESSSSAEEAYTAQRVSINLFAERGISQNVRLGLRYRFYYETIKDIVDNGLLASGAIAGSVESRLSGLGVTVIRDTRDNLYYPETGSYMEAFAILHAEATGSQYSMRRFVVDMRRYLPLGKQRVAAFQLYLEAIDGTVPFTVMPMLGGNELLRGYLEGRYRDNIATVLQGAFRFPLFWRFRGEIFAGLGNVAPGISAYRFNTMRAAVGGGGRFQINPEKLHVRVDMALGSEGISVYFTLSEAF